MLMAKPRRSARTHQIKRWAPIVSAVLALTACTPRLVISYDSTSTAAQRTTTLTSDGWDSYRFASSAGVMNVSALTQNSGGNLRSLFWPENVPVVADSQTCAVWTSQRGAIVQQGAALRIRKIGTERVRAVTVTKNIAYGANWIFNFHTWDTARPGVFQQFGSKEVRALVGPSGLAPLPWRFCARIIGQVIEFKVWTNTMAEPAWGNSTWGGRATIPTGWSTAGTTGWYAGHLQAGDAARFDNLRTWRYETGTRTMNQTTVSSTATRGPTTAPTEPATPNSDANTTTSGPPLTSTTTPQTIPDGDYGGTVVMTGSSP